MPMSRRRERLVRMPEGEATEEQRGEHQFEVARQIGRQQGGEDEHDGQRLDRRVEYRPAQDIDLERGTHELGQRAFEHDQEGDAEQAEGHAPADIEVIGREEQRLGDPEQRQDDQEQDIVAAVVVLVAVADQRGEQQGDNGEQEEVVGEQEERQRPAAAEAHANALEYPRRREKHQGGAVIAADADPVLGRGEQKAAEDGPAETEEHFVGVPLDRREILRGGGQDALEDQDPGDRQAQAGEAGEGEEGPEADQPEGMGAGEHGIQVSLRRGHCCTGAAGWP